MSINKTIFIVLSIIYFISSSFLNQPDGLSSHWLNIIIAGGITATSLISLHLAGKKYLPFVYGALFAIFIRHVFVGYFQTEVSLTSFAYWLTYVIMSIIFICIDVFYDKVFFTGKIDK